MREIAGHPQAVRQPPTPLPQPSEDDGGGLAQAGLNFEQVRPGLFRYPVLVGIGCEAWIPGCSVCLFEAILILHGCGLSPDASLISSPDKVPWGDALPFGPGNGYF